MDSYSIKYIVNQYISGTKKIYCSFFILNKTILIGTKINYKIKIKGVI